MRTEACESAATADWKDQLGWAIVGAFSVVSLVFAVVAIWAIVRLVLFYT